MPSSYWLLSAVVVTMSILDGAGAEDTTTHPHPTFSGPVKYERYWQDEVSQAAAKNAALDYLYEAEAMADPKPIGEPRWQYFYLVIDLSMSQKWGQRTRPKKPQRDRFYMQYEWDYADGGSYLCDVILHPVYEDASEGQHWYYDRELLSCIAQY